MSKLVWEHPSQQEKSNVYHDTLTYGQKKPADTYSWLRNLIGNTSAQRQAGLGRIAAQTGQNLRKAGAHAAGRGLAGSGAAGAMRGQALAGKQVAEQELEARIQSGQLQGGMALAQLEQAAQAAKAQEELDGVSKLTQVWSELRAAGEVHNEDYPQFEIILANALAKYKYTGDASAFTEGMGALMALGGDT
jgi:hypothetical protein